MEAIVITIIVAVVGWVLFLLTAILYVAGNRLNAQESNALAAYSLALLFSDGFRSGLASGFRHAANEALARQSPPESVAYSLMQGITQSAKRYYRSDSDINSVAVATIAIRNMPSQQDV